MDNKSRLRPLYIARILYDLTDEEHFLSTPEIILFDDDEPTVQIGDGNEDGKIDAEDLIVLRRALLTDAKYSKVLDCNGDGVLDIRDLVRMKKHIASGTPFGKIESNS